MKAKLAQKKRANGQTVFVLLDEKAGKPAAVITDQKMADEWSNSRNDRDYYAFIIDDYTPSLYAFDHPGDSNYGKEPPTDLTDLAK